MSDQRHYIIIQNAVDLALCTPFTRSDGFIYCGKTLVSPNFVAREGVGVFSCLLINVWFTIIASKCNPLSAYQELSIKFIPACHNYTYVW